MAIENKIKYAALVVFLITAWFSIGHHQSDEHFQILEFAQYKLGHISADELPWEFHEQMRPSIQPWIVVIVIKFLNFFHIYNPFTITLILRIFSAIVFWSIISGLNKILTAKYFPDKKWSGLFYLSSFFLWFVPYLAVRFSSENYSSIFLLLGLLVLLKGNRNYMAFISLGLLFGLSVIFRYQLAAAVFGIYLWILLKDKPGIVKILTSILSFSGIVAIGIYLDSLFYNEFVITSFNYFKLNLIDGRAADFGTSPWWFYFTTFLLVTVPPISIILLVFFILGTIKLKDHVFTWSIIPFILIHIIIAHKEMRFLFPASYLLIFLSIYGMMAYFKQREIKRYQQIVFKISVWINFILLAFMMFKPAHEMVPNYRFLCRNIEIGNNNIVSIKEDAYKRMAGLRSSFYEPEIFNSYTIREDEELSEFLDENNIEKCYLVYKKYEFKEAIQGYELEKVYCVYPTWLESIKFVDWQKILSTHSIYLINKSNSK